MKYRLVDRVRDWWWNIDSTFVKGCLTFLAVSISMAVFALLLILIFSLGKTAAAIVLFFITALGLTFVLMN